MCCRRKSEETKGRWPRVLARILGLGTLAFVTSNATFLPTLVAQEGNRRSLVHPSVPERPTSPVGMSGAESIVGLKDGRLSVTCRGRPLESLLEEISQKAKVPILSADGVAERLVSVQFVDLPLDEGLRQILREEDAFFFYGADKEEPSFLKGVWVYPKGGGLGLAPAPAERGARTGEDEKALADRDPEVRARAIEGLVRRKDKGALDAVLEALKDEDDEVRRRALQAALEAGMDLPTESVRDLAINDTSPDVRFLALQSVADDPDVRSVAERALSDPSPLVRNKAEAILADRSQSAPDNQ